MIRYALKCADEHDFESWFQSAAAFDKLQAAGMITCAVCGSGQVRKCLMAPSVASTDKAAPAKPLAAPVTQAEQAIAALRDAVEKNSDYVGGDFVHEARMIHAGEAPERAIHGEAAPAEARKLLEDGIPVAPLPFLPARKTN
ncbi:DUF1178 family protein [Actibacterium ureilyticum]|uniref:DUF1178 family protein n=1 Tax=Actibacterium ureilyticum TaxID=1590614 RepID=UPI000BAAFE02|nr:DUF1178 family protein [Actibacterium ureilyticum]